MGDYNKFLRAKADIFNILSILETKY